MTPLDWWLQLVQFFVMAAAAALLWSVRQAFAGGQLIARLEALEKKQAELAIDGLRDKWRHDARNTVSLAIGELSNRLDADDGFLRRRDARWLQAEIDRIRNRMERIEGV